MAGAEQEGAELFDRSCSCKTYGFLDATESFRENKPKKDKKVVNA